MIIWSGKGYFVAIIVFGCSLAAELISETIYHDDNYYQSNPVPLACAMLAAGLIISVLGRYLNKQKTRILIDKETGEEVVIKRNNSFFFIPMEYWGDILFMLSLGILIFKN